MKKFQIMGVALVAVFAFCAFAAASAFAVNPEWLIGGVAVLAATSVQTLGKIRLADTKAPIIGEAAVECEGILDGNVNSEGKDEITEVLAANGVTSIQSITLTKELVTGTLGTGLLCTGTAGCEGTDAEVWPDNLPWNTQLELLNGQVVDHIFGNGTDEPGWHIGDCLVFGVETSDLCEGLTYALIENMLTGSENDLLANFVEPPSLKVPCLEGGPGSGQALSSEGLIETLNGAVITVSGDEVTE
jgi:hypothetical protein